jgi:hypothetical protein
MLRLKYLLVLFVLLFALTGTAHAGSTPPTTTFSYEQLTGTTDTNITLSCSDNNSGCKATNYNVNNEGWNQVIVRGEFNDALKTNLISYYKFDETTGTTAIDSHSTKDGNLVNSIDIGQEGFINTGYFLSGYNKYVSIPNTTLGNNDFAISFWTKNPVANKIIYYKWASEVGTWAIFNSNGTISFNTQSGLGNITGVTTDSNVNIQNGLWNNIVLVRSSTTLQIWVNGIKLKENTGTVRNLTNTNNWVWFNSSVFNNGFNSYVDELALWQRSLTQQEVEDLYANGLGLAYDGNSELSYSFIYSGAGDHNIQYFSTDNADNNEAIKTSFFSTYGLAKFTMKDENSGLDLDDVVYTISPSINGDSGGTLSGTNQLDLNLQGITSGEYTFTFSKTGYGTRTYVKNLNEFSEIDINFALLPTSLSANIPFKIYKTDATTIFANIFIELYKPDTNYVIGRKKTNAQGEVSFNIHVSDQNYLANVNEGEFTYEPVALTILYPKNELTLDTITEKWRIDITQNLFESFTDLNTNKIVYLLPNTSLPFNIKISDMNGNYFARTYAQQFPGNPLTANIQPYLVSIDTGLLTTITTKNASTNVAVPGITIKIYKNISGSGRTLVEEVITDDKGQALVLLELNAEYEFETYSDAEFLKTYTITATSSNIFIYLQPTSTIPTDEPSGFVAQFTPNRTGLNKISVGAISFTQSLTNFAELSFTGTSELIQNGVVLSNQSISATSLKDNSYTRTVNWSDLNIGEVTSRLTIIVSGQTIIFEQTYFINNAFGTDYDLLTGLSSGLRSDFACPSTGICWTLLILGIIISVIIGIYGGMLMGNLTSQSAGIVFLIPLILFTYLSWIPFELTVAMVIILLAFIINERR